MEHLLPAHIHVLTVALYQALRVVNPPLTMDPITVRIRVPLAAPSLVLLVANPPLTMERILAHILAPLEVPSQALLAL